MEGFWCVHCAKVSEADRMASDASEDAECPHCGAGEWNLWPVRGDFQHGQHVPTGSEALANLRLTE